MVNKSQKSVPLRQNVVANLMNYSLQLGCRAFCYGQLKVALKKCDGKSSLPDFVTGNAVSEAYAMIICLMEEFECE